MKLSGKNFSFRRGYTSLIVLVLSLFIFVEAVATVADIYYLPVIYNEDTPTFTPTATNTPTPTIIPGGVIVLSNHSSFASSNDILHIVGEVQNNTKYTLRNIKITADFYNKSNQFLESHSELTFMNDLPPGGKTCFNIALDEPEGWTYYRFGPVTYLTDGEPLPDLNLLNVSGAYSPQYQYYRIAGRVRNDENVTVYEVRTIGTVYNVTGKVLGCNFHQVLGSLEPDESSLFEIYFLDRDYVDVATYRVQADGDIP
jgi:hypothetical protein